MPNSSYQTLADLFKIAEERLKRVEQIDENLHIPAVNELRYVANYILQSLMSDGDKSQEFIKGAEDNCKKSI